MNLRPRLLLLCSALIVTTMLPAILSRATFAQEKEEATRHKGSSETDGQTQTVADEKRSRTPAQKKIDSQLLYALKQKRGETRGVPANPIQIKLDARGRTIVDITSAVPALLVSKIKRQRMGVEVISMSEKYHTVRALVALEKLEALASLKEVRFISPPAKAMTHGGVITH